MSRIPTNSRDSISAFSWAVDQKDKKRKIGSVLSKPESKLSSSPVANDRNSLLLDTLAPESRKELLIHPGKIKEVSDWLEHVFKKDLKYRSIFLIITGPAGSGKLTTLRVLAKESDIQLIEYTEPQFTNKVFFDEGTNSDEEKNDYEYFDHIDNQSQVKCLKSFLAETNTFLKSQNRLIVIKDLPSTLLHEPEKYHTLWQWYHERFRKKGVPIVFILTIETGRDSIIGRLFSKQMKDDFNVDEIQFNPPTKRQVVKWLQKRFKDSLSLEDFENVISDDKCDIRSVINLVALKYGSIICENRSFINSKQTKKRKLDIVKSYSSSKNLKITGRDQLVDIHHFLARILYSKRLSRKQSNYVSLPPHLKQYEKMPLVRDPFSLAESVPIEPYKFFPYLHINYLDFSTDLASAAASIEWLSLTDTIRGEIVDTDALQVYQLSLAISGLMFDICPKKGSESRRFQPINYNHDYFNTQKKAQEVKNELDRVCQRVHKYSQKDLMNDILPYLSVMRRPNKPLIGLIDSRTLGLTKFRDIQQGGFEASKEPFHTRHYDESHSKASDDTLISMQIGDTEETNWKIDCSEDSD